MTSPGALDGIRVLDITQVMAGAYCGMLLADLGADVIKVERPGIGDITRWAGDGVDAFGAVNRNKRSIALDYRNPDGAKTLRRLVKNADVLVENHRPGTLEKHGLGASDLMALNPRLVYCSISGFGAVGPRAGESGFDLMAQGMSGIMSVTGEAGGGPCKAGVPIADLNAAVFASLGVTSALHRRNTTGEGQIVTTSLLESSVAYMVWEAMLWFEKGEPVEAGGSAHRLAAPYEAFQTLDGWITVAAHSAKSWKALCDTLGRAELLEDPRFLRGSDRLDNRAVLAEELSQVIRTKTTKHWDEAFRDVGVASGPIHRVDEVFEDPQVQATEMVVGEGSSRRIGHPIKFSSSPMGVDRPSPGLGEHTREVLAEGGWSQQEIDALFEAEAVEEVRPVHG